MFASMGLISSRPLVKGTFARGWLAQGQFRDGVVEALVFGLIVFSALAYGTVDPWAWIVVMSATLVVATLAFTSVRRLQISAFGWLGLVLLFFSLLQCLPLPKLLIAFLSPRGALRQELEVPRASLPALALVPFAAREATARLLVLAVLFFVSLNFIAKSSERRRRLLFAIVASGLVVALVGYAQHFFFGNRIYGRFAVAPSQLIASPFVNPNHLAAYLGLSSVIALALAAQQHGTARRVLGFAVAAFLAVSVLLCGSRGGAFALLVASFFLAAQQSWRRRGLLASILVLVGLGTAYLFADTLTQGHVSQKFASLLSTNHFLDDAKIHAWRDDVDILFDFAGSGIGHGALAEVSPAYRSQPTSERQTHVENEYLEALIDWGVPIGFLAIVVTLLTLATALGRATGPTSLPTAAALLFIAVHNCFDFNLETGAIGVVTALLAGLLVRQERRHEGLHGGRLPSRWMVATVVMAMPLAIAVEAVAGAHTLAAATRQIDRQVTLDAETATTLASSLLSEHPASSWLRLALANHLLANSAQGPEERKLALIFVERGLVLDPHNGTLELLDARLLVARGESQLALEHFRRASNDGLEDAVVAEAVTIYRSISDLRLLTEPDIAGQLRLGRKLLQVGRREQAHDLITALRQEWPLDSTVAAFAADLAHDEHDGPAEREEALLALSVDSNLSWPYVRLARLAGDDGGAVLRTGLKAAPHARDLLSAAYDFALTHHNLAWAETVLDADEWNTPERLFRHGQIEEARARYPLALEQYQAATALEPATIDYHLAVARMYEKIGILSGAESEYNMLRQLGYKAD